MAEAEEVAELPRPIREVAVGAGAEVDCCWRRSTCEFSLRPGSQQTAEEGEKAEEIVLMAIMEPMASRARRVLPQVVLMEPREGLMGAKVVLKVCRR